MNIAENIPLRSCNTFGINAVARYFTSFSSTDELAEGLAFAARADAPSARPPMPTLILGGGSNILLTKDFDGLVLVNAIKGIDLVTETEHHVFVKAGAGENWHGFVQYGLKRNWAGVENLSLIPGSVGASPMQNIGAYGVEIKEVFHELEAWDLHSGKVRMFTLNDCRFGYRDSVFKQEYRGRFVILNVTYRLSKVPKFHIEYGAIREALDEMGVRQLSIQAISRAVVRIRRAKLPDPAQTGNAGSFFKNPVVSAEQFSALQVESPGIVGFKNPDGAVKLAAGWLIEAAGWKGYRKGDAGCHAKQALVLVNYGQATGAEIYALSEEILQSVKRKFGVTLEREVNII
ncbi:MAG: UDP-N-acetylmuramate dehydrogenase [Bacteroidota bacterium]|nr:UDP-N-acetylmuramate dehydrogenase [Bacteroidota bacterium]